MNVLIAVKGAEDRAFFQRAAALAHLDLADEVLIAHVVDTGPRSGIEQGRDRFMTRRPLGAERSAELERIEQEAARARLQFARQVLMEAGVREQTVREIVLRGRPNEELRALAVSERPDLVVVQGRAGESGPRSLGKTARFVVDHAPGSALLVR